MIPSIRTMLRTKEGRSHLLWLSEHYCKHGHPYLKHPNCYVKEYPDGVIKERIGFLDIEASNLKGDYGIMFCCCIACSDSDHIYESVVTGRQLKKYLDRKVVENCLRDIDRFDRIVTWYGGDGHFDIPFIRTRALDLGLDTKVLQYKHLWQTDGYNISRRKLAMSSNRLKSVSKVVIGKSQKTELERKYWIQAWQGDKKALNYILEHCRYDVKDLKKVYEKLCKFAPVGKTSI